MHDVIVALCFFCSRAHCRSYHPSLSKKKMHKNRSTSEKCVSCSEIPVKILLHAFKIKISSLSQPLQLIFEFLQELNPQNKMVPGTFSCYSAFSHAYFAERKRIWK